MLGRFAPEKIAVSIQESWLGRCAALYPGPRWTAVSPEATALGALIALVKNAPLDDWAFLYHVDMPLWEPGLFDALARAAAAEHDAVVPSFQGRKGHPALLSPPSQAELAGLDPGRERLDHWLRAKNVKTVDVAFPCIHENWNGA